MKTTITRIFSILLLTGLMTSCDMIADLIGVETGDVSIEMSYKGDIKGKFKSIKLASTAFEDSDNYTITGATADLKGNGKVVIIILPKNIEVGSYGKSDIIASDIISFGFGQAKLTDSEEDDIKGYAVNREIPTDFSFSITKNDGTEIKGTFKGTMKNEEDKTITVDGKFSAKPVKE